MSARQSGSGPSPAIGFDLVVLDQTHGRLIHPQGMSTVGCIGLARGLPIEWMLTVPHVTSGPVVSWRGALGRLAEQGEIWKEQGHWKRWMPRRS